MGVGEGAGEGGYSKEGLHVADVESYGMVHCCRLPSSLLGQYRGFIHDNFSAGAEVGSGWNMCAMSAFQCVLSRAWNPQDFIAPDFSTDGTIS